MFAVLKKKTDNDNLVFINKFYVNIYTTAKRFIKIYGGICVISNSCVWESTFSMTKKTSEVR